MQRMTRPSSSEREKIIRRRRCRSDGDGKVHRISSLDLHHKDRNPNNNAPSNLRVLTKKEHINLHKKYG
jgi:hypothetical protein